VALAHRMYARALFQAAQEKGRVEAVHAELTAFVAAIRENDELRSFLHNPEVAPAARISALRDIAGDADPLTRNFLLLTAEKGRTAELEGILKELDRLVAEHQRRLAVELTTAYELSDEDARSIVAQIEKASGRSVEVTRNVDPSLIGGIVLQVGTRRVDASVRGRLERLRQTLVTR